jgi:hypothetical protein
MSPETLESFQVKLRLLIFGLRDFPVRAAKQQLPGRLFSRRTSPVLWPSSGSYPQLLRVEQPIAGLEDNA